MQILASTPPEFIFSVFQLYFLFHLHTHNIAWLSVHCLYVFFANTHRWARLQRGSVRHTGRVHVAPPAAPQSLSRQGGRRPQQGGHGQHPDAQAAHECQPGRRKSKMRLWKLSSGLSFLYHSCGIYLETQDLEAKKNSNDRHCWLTDRQKLLI